MMLGQDSLRLPIFAGSRLLTSQDGRVSTLHYEEPHSSCYLLAGEKQRLKLLTHSNKLKSLETAL